MDPTDLRTHRDPRPRPRALGLAPGVLPPGPLNALTDVAGVRVGHVTRIEGEAVRTGVTAILPHDGNPFRERVPAGLHVGNGFGKLVGATQLVELGELETPVLLTNTLAVARAAEALVDWTLTLPGNASVRSVNPVVGETNDGLLNDIRARGVDAAHALAALDAAAVATPEQGAVGGNVGAGTGTVAFGWKGGIGTASRVLPAALGGWTVGALVQANYGGELRMDGLPVGKALGRYYLKEALDRGDADGSVVVVLATDAPLSDRNLARLAARAMAGIARTGAAMSDGSGDYAIAFSTALEVRRPVPVLRRGPRTPRPLVELPNDAVSPLFLAAIEATEEAVLDALCRAETMTGFEGRTVEALPQERVRGMVEARRLDSDAST
ncbi:MAG: P1 family peptidase [Trueperaceae bacterium]|nr:P1 family peptidase [Trueperaceae bacterium]